MVYTPFFFAITLAAAAFVETRRLPRLSNATLTGRSSFPTNGIRGVNLGSWFVVEPYMMVDDWHAMGGDWLCGDCTQCVNDEYRLTAKLGQSAANSVFETHWGSFITQSDVDLMVSYNLNSVRIPIGFWIIESTVLPGETYPQGGLDYLRKGCAMLKNAGISVILDFHSAPGSQVAYNTFTGHCVDTPGFWTQANFDRLNKAASALTTIVHQEPQNFGTVWGIEALNEPPTDGLQSPGYASFSQQFVSAVRNAENALGVLPENQLLTVFMSVAWQWENNAFNPASVAGRKRAENGTSSSSAYDSHLYYSFDAPCGSQGCVEPTLPSHVDFACSGGSGRIASDADQQNKPEFLGEWWLQPLAGAFSNFDKDSVRAFGDAQKMGYSPEGGNGGFGWYFWSWKMTNPDDDGSTHMRSYKDAVAQGYLPSDASSYFNNAICRKGTKRRGPIVRHERQFD